MAEMAGSGIEAAAGRTAPRYTFNPNVKVTQLSNQFGPPAMLCEVPAAQQSSLRYAIPGPLVDLLRLFDGARDTAEVIEAHHRVHPESAYTAADLDRLIATFFRPKGILCDAVAPIDALPPRPKSYLYARVPLLSKRAAYPLAVLLQHLYWKPLFIALCVISFAAHAWFYARAVPAHGVNINDLNGTQLLWVTALTILAAFFHELGHAAALVKCGGSRVEIGFGLYLHIPVLYTDVSECWRLPARERALVDLGGVYVQSVFGLLLMMVFAAHPTVSLKYALLFIDVSMASSLNPFLRMDGYWLVADVFGIWSLRKQSVGLLKSVLFGWRRRAPKARPAFELSRWSLAVLALYTAVSTGFFSYLFVVVARQVFFVLLPSYPRLWLALFHVIATEPWNLAGILSAFLEIFWKSLVLGGCVMIVQRIVRRIVKWARRRLRAAPDQDQTAYSRRAGAAYVPQGGNL